MATDPLEKLRSFRPTKELFVGIDSDGCVFNSMEVKHNDAFSPNVVKHFGFQAISRQVHQAWDYVSLYSQTRACNRFRAITLVCDVLRYMQAVKRAGVAIPVLPHLKRGMQEEPRVANPKLAE